MSLQQGFKPKQIDGIINSPKGGTAEVEILKDNKSEIIEKPWGCFVTSKDVSGIIYKVKKLIIYPGQMLSLQKHEFRDEIWNIIQGKCEIQIDDLICVGQSNDTFFIKRNSIHRIANFCEENVIIIEIQLGTDLRENDIIRIEDIYGRK